LEPGKKKQQNPHTSTAQMITRD